MREHIIVADTWLSQAAIDFCWMKHCSKTKVIDCLTSADGLMALLLLACHHRGPQCHWQDIERTKP
jgi:hypothetical protein